MSDARPTIGWVRTCHWRTIERTPVAVCQNAVFACPLSHKKAGASGSWRETQEKEKACLYLSPAPVAFACICNYHTHLNQAYSYL